ncbi:35S primary transcript processing-related protein [Dioszegia hungarica]|uniref:35S primary transcript processing-related protein n=1 Tax=Dioszegia hungarica TaxID=4972 RepID=A0AA38LR97_9TREE|nr:35S primary transcript processing-related protein [Dioszegia hungarica]KAI9634182.1 35S primary transcript processing-related protein [Dioszegia hungarica]
MPINQPGTQIKLTNVSVVRLKKGGKRFENKVSEFRSKVETDLSEILQIEQVFANVSKGQVAKKEDWEKAFNTTDLNKAIEEILRKGELQVNNLERTHNLHALSREIATLVSEMTVDPSVTPPRKHTVGMIEKAMSEVGYSVKSDKAAKAQALELIKKLAEGDILPIRRMRMRIRVTMPAKDAKRIGEKIKAEGEVEEEDAGEEWEVIMQVEPGAFKTLSDLISNETKGKGRVESLAT